MVLGQRARAIPRLTGGVGVALLVLSFGYSLRKRKLALRSLSMKRCLLLHECLAVAGTVVLAVHTAGRLHAMLPLLTFLILLLVFFSGLLGRRLYDRARSDLFGRGDRLAADRIQRAALDERVATQVVASARLSRWRLFHLPFVSLLGCLAVYHAVVAMYYGGF
jgi:hypothetical protein